MNTGIRQATFNIEEKLANIHLTQSQQSQARDAFRMAADVVEVMEFLVGAVKRLAEAVSLKPSVRT